jgi:hypothetical protein
VELAVEWYHRVITEFPKSASAEIAFERKLFTLFGWREPGENGNAFSVEKDLGGYMPMVLPTFEQFERAFPNSPYLQAFRYQIAQTYWAARDWENARTWLARIVDTTDPASFYAQAAQARLAMPEK